jgi:hypothetical protein
MSAIKPSVLPAASLLRAYSAGTGYADCFVAELPGASPLASFVEAFYTSPLFKLERAILRALAGRPSSDQQARDLASGARSTFAAWKVEDRRSDQLLLVDFTGRTRSWLMVEPFDAAAGARGTRLYFGSAVVPRKGKRAGSESMGLAFHALLGFHKLYSRLLLRSACARLLSRPRNEALRRDRR